MEKDKTKLSPKSTKNEILKAYDELLSKYEAGASKVADKKAEVKAAANKAIVDKVSAYTVDNIVKGLADFKLKIGKALTDLTEQLTEEAQKLTEIKQAIVIETAQLNEIHDIRISADTLADLIRAQEERKIKFEAEITEQEESFKNEMARRKAEWAKEQTEYALVVKERDVKLKKERDREKEEYEYDLTLTRKKDKDSYEDRKAALENALQEKKLAQEKDLSERAAAVAAREKELAENKAKVEKFPAELSEAVKKAEKAALSVAENKAKVEAQLLAKEVEGQKKLAEQKILSVEDIIAKQNSQIQTLTKQLTKVQSIAVKVIESNADRKALEKVNEIALEQAKKLNINR